MGEVEVDMRNLEDLKPMSTDHIAAAASSSPSSAPQYDSSRSHIDSSKEYGKNLQGMKKIALVAYLTDICNCFLGFCALTWASAVLLGAYVDQLRMRNYYDVSFLLFLHGLYVGLAAFLRLLGYRLPKFTRWPLRSAAFVLPLVMGGCAVFSISDLSRRRSASAPLNPAGSSSFNSLFPSLYIFYGVILLNAFILLLSNSITGLMRLHYVNSNCSLSSYHDKMLDCTTSTTISWLRPTVDLDFAFQIQGHQYRPEERRDQYQTSKEYRPERYVCENYKELIWYLYMEKEGVEAAEAALAAEDRYVREAAANIIGFWAILDTVPEVKQRKPCTPLCCQRGILSKLADIAAESYDSLGIAAARSFTLLLKSVDPESVGVVANVRLRSTGEDLIDILLSRAAECLHPPYPSTSNLAAILQVKSHAHIYALREYLERQLQSESKPMISPTFIEAQRAQLEERIKKALPELVIKEPESNLIQSLNEKLSSLLESVEPDDHKNYESEISRYLTSWPPAEPAATSRSSIGASVHLLLKVARPLVCIGIGFVTSTLFLGTFDHAVRFNL